MSNIELLIWFIGIPIVSAFGGVFIVIILPKVIKKIINYLK